MQCVILAGGLGTRMQPLTTTIPKALVPVNGTPFARLQLELIANQGVARVLYLIGHLGELIVDEIGSGHEFGLEVTYAREPAQLMGTAGALRLAHDAGLLDDSFLLLYGDSYLPVDYPPVFKALMASKYAAVMTVLNNAGAIEASNAAVAGDRVVTYVKGGPPDTPELDYIDYGLAAVHRSTIARMVEPAQVTDLASVYSMLAARNELGAHIVQQRFFEVGSRQGLHDLEEFMTRKESS